MSSCKKAFLKNACFGLLVLFALSAGPVVAQIPETKPATSHPDRDEWVQEVTTKNLPNGGVSINIAQVKVKAVWSEKDGCYGYKTGEHFVLLPWLTKPASAPKSVNVNVQVHGLVPAPVAAHPDRSVVVTQYRSYTDKFGTHYMPYRTRVTLRWQPLHKSYGYTDNNGRFHLVP